MRARLAVPGSILSLTLVLAGELAGQGTGTLVVAKDGSGPISATSLAFSLHARVPCDQTQTLIPDDSRLVTDDFAIVVDEKGHGTFRGVGAVFGPDGRPLLQVLIRGLVGLGAPAVASADCASPRRLEGSIEGLPTLGVDGPTPGRPDFAPGIGLIEARFSADPIAESASALPLYRVRVDGVLSGGAPPRDGRVAVAPDRPSYGVDEPITAFVKNGSSAPIGALDGQSYCTVVQLQRETDGRWVEVAGCPLARMPLPTLVRAGEALEVRLPPDATTRATKEPGAYRLSLTFAAFDAAGKAGERSTIVSNAFRVASVPPPPAAAMRVSLATDRPGYRAGEAIVVTIVNTGDQPIVTADHRSFCTIVGLQRIEKGGPVEVAPCLVMTPTRTIRIEPKEIVKVTLPPAPAAAGDLSTRPLAGSYKVVFEFSPVGPDGRSEPSATIESDPFSIFSTRTTGSELNR